MSLYISIILVECICISSHTTYTKGKLSEERRKSKLKHFFREKLMDCSFNLNSIFRC